MKIWISKYALTDGIKEIEADLVSDSMVRIGSCSYLHGEGREWHRTKEGAIIRANEMRKRKINSIRKTLSKLEIMKF